MGYFQPQGMLIADLEEVKLTVDEYEALRLADLEELYQEEAAGKLGVSRQTFGNIIASAHRKLADAIVNSKALKIEGGVFRFARRCQRCPHCKPEMGAAPGVGKTKECPKCLEKITAGLQVKPANDAKEHLISGRKK